jgi:hypothetical protein
MAAQDEEREQEGAREEELADLHGGGGGSSGSDSGGCGCDCGSIRTGVVLVLDAKRTHPLACRWCALRSMLNRLPLGPDQPTR